MVMAVAMAIIIVAIAMTMIVAMTTAFFFIKIFFNCLLRRHGCISRRVVHVAYSPTFVPSTL